jgi:hypothetical protein
VETTRNLLEEIGLEGKRLKMINISSAMAGQFAAAAEEITAEVEKLGPNPLRSNGHGLHAGDQTAENDSAESAIDDEVRDRPITANPEEKVT